MHPDFSPLVFWPGAFCVWRLVLRGSFLLRRDFFKMTRIGGRSLEEWDGRCTLISRPWPLAGGFLLGVEGGQAGGSLHKNRKLGEPEER